MTTSEEGFVKINRYGSDFSLCYSDDMSPQTFDALCNAAGHRFMFLHIT